MSQSAHSLKLVALVLCLVFSISYVSAQQWRENIQLDELIQDLVQQDENTNYEDLYESLFQYKRNPINLNHTNSEELQNLYILSKDQIRNLIEYEKKFGKLLSIYELQAVPGFDVETIYRLAAFSDVREQAINISNEPFLKRLRTEENNSILYRIERTLETQKGYTPSTVDSSTGKIANRYLGSPIKHFLRLRTSHKNDFALGITATKGQGEKFIWQPNSKRYGFDFYSMHFVKYNIGRIKAIALGDYQLQFGQGLIMAGGFAIGKGSETTQTIRRSNTGIRPYTSSIESGFLRGVATTIEVNKRLDLSLFGSKNKLDGALVADTSFIIEDSLNPNDVDLDQFLASNINPSDFDEDLFNISNINSNGLHRTITETLRKRKIEQNVVGGNISYKSLDKNLKGGFTFVNTSYSQNFNRSGQLYNSLEFNGTQNTTYGLNYSYNWQNFNFFGELAQSSSGGIGLVNGFVSNLSTKVEYAMMFRHFDPNFHSFYGNAFSEATRNINETGLYQGIKIRANRKWTITAYYDQFKFSWLRFQADAPSHGTEYLVQANYKITRKIKLYGRVKVETKGVNLRDNETPLDYVVPVTKKQYILNLDYGASRTVSMKSRVQFSKVGVLDNVSGGYAIIQDFNFKVNKWTFSTRYALFDTDNFDNRQYTYEKDVLYAFSIPAYNGKGIRTYILARYKASKKLDFWLKVGRYLYAFEPGATISSGLNEIQGNKQTTARFQMRVRL